MFEINGSAYYSVKIPGFICMGREDYAGTLNYYAVPKLIFEKFENEITDAQGRNRSLISKNGELVRALVENGAFLHDGENGEPADQIVDYIYGNNIYYTEGNKTKEELIHFKPGIPDPLPWDEVFTDREKYKDYPKVIGRRDMRSNDITFVKDQDGKIHLEGETITLLNDLQKQGKPLKLSI